MRNIQTTYSAAKSTARGTRVWIEGQKLSLVGFTPDTLYSVLYDAIAKRITLTIDPTNSYYSVSSKHLKKVTNVIPGGQYGVVASSRNGVERAAHKD